MSRVLIVFADPVVGARLASLMTDAGLDTRAVTSGERAMDSFIQEPADVVLIDFELEGRDGVTTAEAIRWMPGGRHARMILTAQKDPGDDPLSVLGAAVDAFAAIVGPLDHDRLCAMVQRAAAVEPQTGETRVYGMEPALLVAERKLAAGGGGSARLDIEEPAAAPLTLPLPESATPLATDRDDATLDEAAASGPSWEDTDGSLEAREVRAVAEAEAGADSDLLGTFEEMRFARVIHRLAEKRASGALICVHPADQRVTPGGTEPIKVVYFRSGVPTHVRSNLVAECLDHVLRRQRKIGPAALRESLRVVRRGASGLSQRLVEWGALAPVELSEALAHQMRLKLFELFAWRRGTFRFAPGREPPEGLIDLELGLAEIAFGGVRATMDGAKVLEMLEPHRDRYVIPQARELVRFVGLSGDRGIRSVIVRADGSRTLDEILEGSGDRGRAAQLLHAMECLDAVRFEAGPLRARGRTPRSPEESLPSVPSVVEMVSSAPFNGDAFDDPSPTDPEPGSAVGAAPEGEREPGPPAEPTFVAKHPAPATIEEPTEPEESNALEAAPPPDGAGSGLRTKPEAELDERVKKLLKAERRFRRGQRALQKSSHDAALEAFGDAVELCPDEGQFVVHLAWARYQSDPNDAQLLERCVAEVERGSELAPDLAEGHVLRARLLEKAGRRHESLRAYRRVLEIEPSHVEAQNEMSQLED